MTRAFFPTARKALSLLGSSADSDVDEPGSADDEAGDGRDAGDAGETRRADDLAGAYEATHVFGMQVQTKTPIVGFMEVQVGSMAVRVPIRTAEPAASLPLASFEVEGENYAILIRGDSSSKAVERAMGDAAEKAIAHLSRKLLN